MPSGEPHSPVEPHVRQPSADVRPVVVEYMPAAHATHTLLPVAEEAYVAAAHSVHAVLALPLA